MLSPLSMEASTQKAAARSPGLDWRNVGTVAVMEVEGMRIRDVEWQLDKSDLALHGISSSWRRQ